jgi:hypothetical protein
VLHDCPALVQIMVSILFVSLVSIEVTFAGLLFSQYYFCFLFFVFSLSPNRRPPQSRSRRGRNGFQSRAGAESADALSLLVKSRILFDTSVVTEKYQFDPTRKVCSIDVDMVCRNTLRILIGISRQAVRYKRRQLDFIVFPRF